VQHELRQEEHALYIHVEDLVEISRFNLLHGFVAELPGIIDQDVTMEEKTFNFLKQEWIKLELRKIKFASHDLYIRNILLAFIKQFSQTVTTPGDGHDLVAFMPGENFYNLGANSLAGTRYYNVHGVGSIEELKIQKL